MSRFYVFSSIFYVTIYSILQWQQHYNIHHYGGGGCNSWCSGDDIIYSAYDKDREK